MWRIGRASMVLTDSSCSLMTLPNHAASKMSQWSAGKLTVCFTTDFNTTNSPPNWHQTVLSREEYFSAYPETVELVAKSTAVGDDETNLAVKEELEALDGAESPEQRAKLAEKYAPSTDALLSMWQSAQATAREARAALEAAEQAEREAEEAVKAALGKYGWGESVVGDDEWIEWGGVAKSPVEDGVAVDVKMKNGSEHYGQLISDECWSDKWGDASVVAYRISK